MFVCVSTAHKREPSLHPVDCQQYDQYETNHTGEAWRPKDPPPYFSHNPVESPHGSFSSRQTYVPYLRTTISEVFQFILKKNLISLETLMIYRRNGGKHHFSMFILLFPRITNGTTSMFHGVLINKRINIKVNNIMMILKIYEYFSDLPSKQHEHHPLQTPHLEL